MGKQRPRGEQWSSMYHNPALEHERYQADTTMLIGDIRRTMCVGISIVVAFGCILILSGGIEAGLNLMLIAGVPLLLLAFVGEALRLWTQRGADRHSTHVPTIFDQLADSPDGQQKQSHPR